MRRHRTVRSHSRRQVHPPLRRPDVHERPMRQEQPEQYKAFPPRWRNLRMPISSRAGALATLGLWSPCRRRALLLQRLAWGTVRVVGVRVLPGAVGPWEPPWEEAVGQRLATQWRDVIGPFDGIGIYERNQVAREGLALLLLKGGRAVAFAKIRTSVGSAVHPALQHEHDVLGLVQDAPTAAFTHPSPLGVGVVQSWSYLLMTAMPAGLDRPAATQDVQPVLTDIRTALRQLPRGRDVPAAWEPMHGDLTPWNLRVRRDGQLTLVDWEDAGWGPPGADAVMLHASRSALFGVAPPALPGDAAGFWLQRIADRPGDRLDDRLHLALAAALRDIAGGSA